MFTQKAGLSQGVVMEMLNLLKHLIKMPGMRPFPVNPATFRAY